MAFWAGGNTLKVPMALHALNRTRLVERLRAHGVADGVVLLRGAPSESRFDTDHELFTRQESFFQWLFGVKEPDFFGAVEVASGRSILFAPRLPAEYAVWMGRIKEPAEFREAYGVAEVRFVDQLATSWEQGTRLLLLQGTNTDSGATAQPAAFEGIERYARDTTLLFEHIVELRVIKTEAELDVLRYVAQLSADAHKKVITAVRPGMLEYQAEALFRYHCHHDGGCREQAYSCICACGPNAATLHYGHAGAPNERAMQAGETVLFDMGAEYHCYCADITVCFPVSGRFSDEQAFVYSAVLAASRAVIAAMRPGVSWLAMHRLAERVILAALLEKGVVRGTLEQLVEGNVGALFMPHGLGHLLGLDTHDVGGWPARLTRPTEPGVRKLRNVRPLEAGMVITVEPGCYFIRELLEPAFATHGHLLVEEEVRKRFGCGGVRIEDDVEVTAEGASIMSAGLPRTVQEIEDFMAAHNPHVKIAVKRD